MTIINKEMALILHNSIIKETGGKNGVRDFASLDSAISAVYQTFNGISLYPTIEERAARICYDLICSHPFVDGNKRVATQIMLMFLKQNGIQINCSKKEIVALGYNVASGKIKYTQILSWINLHKQKNKTTQNNPVR